MRTRHTILSRWHPRPTKKRQNSRYSWFRLLPHRRDSLAGPSRKSPPLLRINLCNKKQIRLRNRQIRKRQIMRQQPSRNQMEKRLQLQHSKWYKSQQWMQNSKPLFQLKHQMQRLRRKKNHKNRLKLKPNKKRNPHHKLLLRKRQWRSMVQSRLVSWLSSWTCWRTCQMLSWLM